jgi:hypothetical protein
MKRTRCYAFLAFLLILFSLLMLATLREACAQAPYSVTFTATGLNNDALGNTVLTLGGTDYVWNSLPTNFEVDSEGITFTWAPTVAGVSGERFVYTGDDSGLTSPITANGTDAATYKTQYLVSFTQIGISGDAGGTTVLTLNGIPYAYNALPSSLWVDGESTFNWSSPVAGVSGERFVYTGDDSGLTSPITASGTDAATYKTQYQHTITSSPAAGSGYVTVDGGAVTTPYTTPWWDSGSTHTIAANSPVTLVSGQSQYIFSSWSDSGAQSHSVSPTAVTTYTAVFQLQYYFSVSSANDAPTGEGWYNAGTSVSSTTSRPVSGGTGIQYETTGWTGTGSLSSGGSSGSSSTGSFTLNAYTTCTWNWKTQYYLTVSSAHDSPTPVSGWFDSGSGITESVTSPVTVGNNIWTCIGWTGTGSVPSSGTGISVPFSITQNSGITWNWQVLNHTLTVYSLHDSPSPNAGPHVYSDGTSVTCSVISPVTEGSNVWTCTGWTSTGSVSPPSGSGLTVTFTMSQDSSITWSWYSTASQSKLAVTSAHDSPSPGVGNTIYSDGTFVTCSVSSPVTENGTVWTCTGWSGAGSVPLSGTVTSVSFTISQDSSITWIWQGSAAQHTLTVYSLHGSPNPSTGGHLFSDGSSVTCNVTSPVTEGSNVWTCTGWTGTGSVPSSGAAYTVTFAISQDSTITWNWYSMPVQRKLTVTSVHDSPNPSAGFHFYADGTSVTCNVSSPVTENGNVWTCTGWTGTGSVPSSGNFATVTFTITQDSSITWNWHSSGVQQYTLTVISAHGTPSPAVGNYLYDDNDSVTCIVVTPVTESGITYVCTGWTGTGSVPSSGTASSTTFIIHKNSTITWGWQIAHWTLTVSSVHGSPSPSLGDHTYNDGSSVTCNVSSPVTEAGVSYTCTGWSGTGSIPSSGSATSIIFSITGNSTITWNWIVTPSAQWELDVSSAHGNPNPAIGQHLYGNGTSVTCTVPSPVNESGTIWTCTGWSGSGSVPSGGSDVSVTFSITQNSSITWNWVTASSVQWKLTIVSAHGNPSPSVGDHLYNNETAIYCSISSPVVENGVSYLCTGWKGAGSAPLNGSGTSTTFTITENSTITWNWQVKPQPTVESCDGTGVKKDVFSSNETVFITGAGFAQNQTYTIYFVNETTWNNGMAIPERVQGTATAVSSDSSGKIGTTIVSNEYLTPGNYDILVDVNGTGKYNAQVDPLYSIQIVPTTAPFLIPEYVFGTILGLAGCFAALGAFRIYNRKRR